MPLERIFVRRIPRPSDFSAGILNPRVFECSETDEKGPDPGLSLFLYEGMVKDDLPAFFDHTWLDSKDRPGMCFVTERALVNLVSKKPFLVETTNKGAGAYSHLHWQISCLETLEARELLQHHSQTINFIVAGRRCAKYEKEKSQIGQELLQAADRLRDLHLDPMFADSFTASTEVRVERYVQSSPE